MMNDDIPDRITRWFETHGQGDGPLLPDGWHGGKPHEGFQYLEGVDSDDNRLTIFLSEHTVLQLSGPVRIVPDDRDLVLEGFTFASLRWQAYGGGPDAPYLEKVYHSGQIRFAAPITL
jgi:hypothetical protein